MDGEGESQREVIMMYRVLFILSFLMFSCNLIAQLDLKITDSVLHIPKNTSLTNLEISISNQTDNIIYLMNDLNFETKQLYVPETEEEIKKYYCASKYPIMTALVLIREEKSLSYHQLESTITEHYVYPIDYEIKFAEERIEDKKFDLEDKVQRKIDRLRIKRLKIMESGNPILKYPKALILNYLFYKENMISFEPNSTKVFNITIFPINSYWKEKYKRLKLKLLLPNYNVNNAKDLFQKTNESDIADRLFEGCLQSNEITLIFD